jgi:N-acetylglucosaminyl-diphospho-decaprenol L-rhamnosyltransferase
VSRVDVVVVSFNSRDQLRACVEPLLGAQLHVFVVDNASTDGSPDVVADLPVSTIRMETNRGFAAGCNAGWRAGEAPSVLFLNPDARIDPASVERLVAVLAAEEAVGAVAPRILHSDGSLDYSLRRFPRLRSTYAQALFLHRLFPTAAWSDELVRNPRVYERPGSPDWVSGACMLLRRSTLERLGGLDEGFFHYGEDIDLCRRLRDLGYDIRYEPAAVAVHDGGGSMPRPTLLPRLAASRIRYARKHAPPHIALLERVGVGLGALTHVLTARNREARAGHARSLRTVVAPARPTNRPASWP